MKVYTFMCIILTANTLHAAFENDCLYARAEGIGGAFVSIADDIGAIWYNPAGLIQDTVHEICISYINSFGLSDIKHNTIGYVMPRLKRFRVGILYHQLVSYNYKESQKIYSIGISIKENVSLGINLKHLLLDIDRYMEIDKYKIDIGMLYISHPNISIGLMVRAGNCSTTYNAGLSIKPTQGLLISGNVNNYSEISIGQEYWVTKYLCIRCGIKRHELTLLTAGLGIVFNFLQIDYASRIHPVMGITQILSITRKW
jgi:hypothetical protein